MRRWSDTAKSWAREIKRDVAALYLAARDPRTPVIAKIVAAGVAAYALSPIDLIPEVIPVVGWADDVVVIMFAIDALIDRAGPELVQEHWDGPGDLLGLVRDVVGLSRNFVPKRLGQFIDRLNG